MEIHLRQFMPIPKALADENRVRMLLALNHGELCVCRLTDLFGLSASTTSKHLSILYSAGLVNSRTEGRWMYYSLAGKEASPAVRHALRWVFAVLQEDPQIQADSEQLKSILTAAAQIPCPADTRQSRPRTV
jgi:DNA-binding transcriptional ArsR family regulator